MNVLIPLVLVLAAFGLAVRYYGRTMNRVFGVDLQRPTPAIAQADGIDYCATRSHIVFGHHFATIAGAGPIVGPVIALAYGWLPALLWIVIGSIFIGAVHDMSALFVSVRERGHSIADIARRALGNTGYALFVMFSLCLLILVAAVFLELTAKALTSTEALETLGLAADQTLLKTTTVKGEVHGVLGGIASTSVIVITCIAPILGLLYHRAKIHASLAYAIAAATCVVSVLIGFLFPLRMDPEHWKIALSIYTLIAAGLPVWILLQPRDFTNVQLLYIGLIVILAALLVGGVAGTAKLTEIQPTALGAGAKALGPVWPMMFITIACGAISGFHCFVASGTSSKQLATERDIRTVGYGGMILEGLLAVGVVLALATSLPAAKYTSVVWPGGARGNPVLGFALGVGGLLGGSFGLKMALGTVIGLLLVEGFLATTLDSCIRLTRYMFEELWSIVFGAATPRVLRWYWFNSGLAVVLMFLLAYFGTWKAIWPLFGASNQLLASLGLITVSVWLVQRGRSWVYTLLPTAFMGATAIGALVWMIRVKEQLLIRGGAAVLLALAAGVALMALRVVLRREATVQTPETPASSGE